MVFIRCITIIFITLIVCLVIATPVIFIKIVYEIWKNFNMQKCDCYKCKHCMAIRNPDSTTVPYFCENERDFVEGFMKCKNFEKENKK